MESYFYQFNIIDLNNEKIYFKYFADKGLSEQDIKDLEQGIINEMELFSCKFVSRGYET